MKIKELFTDESKWTKNTLARDKNGKETRSLKDDSQSFCLAGAIEYCYQGSSENKILDIYQTVREKIKEKYFVDGIFEFNDNQSTTFKDIKELVESLDV